MECTIINCCENGDLGHLQELCAKTTKDLSSVTDRDGFSPLLTAIHNYQNHIVHFLLSLPDFSIEKVSNSYKSNPLHVAAYKRNLGALQMLLHHCYEKKVLDKLVNQQDKWGKTPLHHAVYHGFTPGIDILLRHEVVDRSVKDYNQKVPMDYLRSDMDASLFL